MNLQHGLSASPTPVRSYPSNAFIPTTRFGDFMNGSAPHSTRDATNGPLNRHESCNPQPPNSQLTRDLQHGVQQPPVVELDLEGAQLEVGQDLHQHLDHLRVSNHGRVGAWGQGQPQEGVCTRQPCVC